MMLFKHWFVVSIVSILSLTPCFAANDEDSCRSVLESVFRNQKAQYSFFNEYRNSKDSDFFGVIRTDRMVCEVGSMTKYGYSRLGKDLVLLVTSQEWFEGVTDFCNVYCEEYVREKRF